MRRGAACLVLLLFLGSACSRDPVKKLKEDPLVLGIAGLFYFTREDLARTVAYNQATETKDPTVESRLLDGLVNDLLVLSDGVLEKDEAPSPLGPNSDPKAREEAVASLLRERVYSKVSVTDAQVEAYYKAHAQEYTRGPGILLREMLLGGEKQAREADKLLRRGEPFADVAKAYSVSPGEVGARYFEFAELPEYLQPQLSKLEAGRLTRPIAVSPDLFQIILVLQRSESYTPPLEDVSDQIRLQLTDEEGSRAYGVYLAGLRQRFLVQVFWAKLSFQYVKEAP